jgi:hypothetical protein
MNTDIAQTRFSDKARWGEKAKEKFKILEERQLEQRIKKKEGRIGDINMDSIKAIYRNLRENYDKTSLSRIAMKD